MARSLPENSHCKSVTKAASGVPLLNPKESDLLSLLGGELRMILSQQALSHPREDKPSPHDPSQRPEPGQTGACSHLSDKIWVGQIHQWLTMDKGCGSTPLGSAHLRLYLPHLQAREGAEHRGRTSSLGCLPPFRLQNEAHTRAPSGDRAQPSLPFEAAMLFWKSPHSFLGG